MMKIYGHPMSICTRTVMMAAAETSVPFELVTLDFLKNEHKGAENLARQPFGRMPSIDDEGFQMYESRAIARYINDKGGGALAPKDAKGRAKMEQWMSVETSEYHGHAMKFVFHYIFHRQQDAAVLDAARSGLQTTLATMEKQLGETPYLAGQDFSLADVCFMPCTEYMMATPAKEILQAYPNVMAWWGRVSSRPGWKKTLEN